MWGEIQRKVFHLFGLMYLVGLILVPRSTYLVVLSGLLVVEMAWELARLRSPRFHRWVHSRFGRILREKEEYRFSGVFWMLTGVFATVAIAPVVPIAAAAILYLLLGDAIASLAGKRFGGPTWPRSEKRISGSAACFVMCVFVGVVLLRPDFHWHGIVIGALVATAVEAATWSINDNFSIPVTSALALMASYHIMPFIPT